jgi:antitoxin MazE
LATQTTILRWGNSSGVRLPKAVLADARLHVGDAVELRVREGEIVVAPARPTRGRYRIEDLLADLPADGPEHASEVDWGPPVGREAW